METWNVHNVAEVLKRSPGAVRNLVLRRKIPYRKVGGRLVFLPDEIAQWIKYSPGTTIEQIARKER